VTRQKSAEEALRRTAEQYREIFEFAPEAIFRITKEGKTLAMNPAGARLLGYDSPKRQLPSSTIGAARYGSTLQSAPPLSEFWNIKEKLAAVLVNSDARTERFFGASCRSAKSAGRTARRSITRDSWRTFTDQKALEADLGAKVRELHSAERDEQRAAAREDRRGAAFRVLQDRGRVGGYRMAWVGFAEEGPEKRILPVAHYGHEDGYLKIVNVTWADTERGQGPTGRAFGPGRLLW
jgi:hypothetical protein